MRIIINNHKRHLHFLLIDIRVADGRVKDKGLPLMQRIIHNFCMNHQSPEMI